jgi:hypothetical protein
MAERHDDRVDRHDERIDDLEVTDADARDVAGGKEANPLRHGRRKNVHASGVRRLDKKES